MTTTTTTTTTAAAAAAAVLMTDEDVKLQQKLRAELSSYGHFLAHDDSEDEEDEDDEEDDDSHVSDVSESHHTVGGDDDDDSSDEDDGSSDDDDDDDEDDRSLALSLQGLLDRSRRRHCRRSLKKYGVASSAATASTDAAATAAAAAEDTASSNVRRVRSMPDMFGLLDLGTTTATTATTSSASSSDQVQMTDQESESLRNFMKRVNSASSLTYMQEPTTSTATTGMGDDSIVLPNSSSHHSNNRRASLRMSKDDTGIHTNVHVNKLSPQQHFQDLLHDLTIDLDDDFWKAYFETTTPDKLAAYQPHVVKAMRAQDLVTLQHILTKEGPWAMDACNRQGETLLHLAARRRNPQLVQFLIVEAGVPVRVRDDWHKTPLHELCWHAAGDATQGVFDSVKLLTQQAPELWFARDKRGFTPLQYVPKDSWKDWCGYLDRQQKLLRGKAQLLSFVRSRDKLQATLQKAESALSLLSHSNKSLTERLSHNDNDNYDQEDGTGIGSSE